MTQKIDLITLFGMAFFPTIKETFLELIFRFISLYHYLKKNGKKLCWVQLYLLYERSESTRQQLKTTATRWVSSTLSKSRNICGYACFEYEYVLIFVLDFYSSCLPAGKQLARLLSGKWWEESEEIFPKNLWFLKNFCHIWPTKMV